MDFLSSKKLRLSVPSYPDVHPQLDDGRGGLTALDIVDLLRRHLWLIGFVIVAGTVASAVAAYTLPEVFTANSTLIFEKTDARYSEVASELEGNKLDKSAVETEMNIIESRQFGGRIVDSLNLLSDPYFNVAIQKVAEKGDLEKPANNAAPTGADRKAALSTALYQRERTISKFLGSLKVKQAGDSLAVNISIDHNKADRAAELANAVADTYVDFSLDQKKETLNAAIDLMKARADQLAEQIAKAEQAIADHIRDNQLDFAGNDNSPDRALRGEIAQLRARLELLNNQPAGTASTIGASEIEQIKVRLEMLEGELQQRALADIRRRTMEQELIAQRNRYNMLIERLVTLDNQADLQKASARVISRSEVPTSPSFPRRRIMIAGGFIGSAMLAALLALLMDGITTKIRSEHRTAQIVGLPNLAYIPEVPSGLSGKAGRPFNYLKDRPGSFFAEAFRSLLIACLRSDLDHPPKVIMMSSALPGEGKSTVALGLAVTAAQIGYRTVMVDFDLHRHGVSQMLGITRRNDKLVSYLNGEVDLADIIMPHPEVPDLDVISSSLGAISPSMLLNSDLLPEMFNTLRESYDIVIVDTPAALILNDAYLLAPYADSVICVVRWGHTTEKTLQDAVGRFRINHVPMTGTVINRVDPRVHARHGYGGSLAYYKHASQYYSE